VKELIVDIESELYTFLRNNLNTSKNNIKSYLTHELISVNGKTVTKYNYLLKKNDKITIGAKKVDSFLGNIKIIYEDKNYLVVDKPSGMLTIATEEDKDANNNLYSVLLKYLKKKNSNSRLYVVHRLDKDTSGVLLFVKDEKLMELLQRNWNETTTRIYYAVVNGITNKSGVIKSYLCEDKNLVTYSSNEGKIAITEYKRIKNNDNYSLLEINIKTGRRNQIRVHMKEIGHPIVGDSKYGHKDKDHKRMMLHASKLVILNPINKKEMTFESKIDNKFTNLVD
jgi:23S rRNA pseudouridine1911/1915/1917 synthase